MIAAIAQSGPAAGPDLLQDPDLAIAALVTAAILTSLGAFRAQGRTRWSVVFTVVCLFGCAVVAASRIEVSSGERRGSVVLVGASSDEEAELESELRERGIQVRRVGRPDDDLVDAMAAAALARRDSERLVGQLGERTSVRRGARPVAPDPTVVTTLEPLPFDPDGLLLRPIARPVVGRPVDLEVVLPRGFAATEVQVRIGEEQLAVRAESGSLRAEWTPALAGPVAVQIEGKAGIYSLRGNGSIDVAEASAPIWVLGDRGNRLVDALRTQDLDARSIESLPAAIPSDEAIATDNGAPFAVVLAARSLSIDEQKQLVSWLDRGTGVFLVGGPAGALPTPGQPLAAPSPFTPLDPPAEPQDSGADAAGDGDATSAETEPEVSADPEPPVVDPAVSQPPDPIVPPDAPKGPDTPPEPEIRGDVSAADLDSLLEAEVERRSVGLVLVIDGSNSMNQLAGSSSISKGRLATAAAIQTARELRTGDEIGVIAFAGAPRIVVPFGPLGSRREFEDRVRSIRPHGSSMAHFGAELGVDWITNCDLPVRHVVLLTDGVLERRIADLTAYQAKRARSKGATFSVIQVDSTGQTSMLRIADFGGGQYIAETDGAAIPRLLLAEVQRVLGAAAKRPSEDVGDRSSADEQPKTGETDPKNADANDAGSKNPEERPEANDPKPPDSSPKPDPDPKTEPEQEPTAGGDEDAAKPEPEIDVLAVAPSPLVDPFVKDSDLPRLFAVDPVESRPEADQLLAAFEAGAPTGSPLLGFANRGLGRIGAFASELPETWWNDPRLPAVLATWVQATAPWLAESARPPEIDLAHSWSPMRPTITEFDRKVALSARAPVRPEDLVVHTRTERSERPRDADDAFWLLGLLVLLLVGERALRA